MKYVLIFILFFVAFHAKAQRNLLSDSLTLRSSSSWILPNSETYTAIASDCNIGTIYVFYQNKNKVIKRECIDSKWTEKRFVWKAVKKGNDNIIQLINGEEVIESVLIQIIREGTTTFTRLTQLDYNGKKFSRLIRKK